MDAEAVLKHRVRNEQTSGEKKSPSKDVIIYYFFPAHMQIFRPIEHTFGSRRDALYFRPLVTSCQINANSEHKSWLLVSQPYDFSQIQQRDLHRIQTLIPRVNYFRSTVPDFLSSICSECIQWWSSNPLRFNWYSQIFYLEKPAMYCRYLTGWYFHDSAWRRKLAGTQRTKLKIFVVKLKITVPFYILFILYFELGGLKGNIHIVNRHSFHKLTALITSS